MAAKNTTTYTCDLCGKEVSLPNPIGASQSVYPESWKHLIVSIGRVSAVKDICDDCNNCVLRANPRTNDPPLSAAASDLRQSIHNVYGDLSRTVLSWSPAKRRKFEPIYSELIMRFNCGECTQKFLDDLRETFNFRG